MNNRTCTYSFYRTNPVSGLRERVLIQKNKNKLTALLRGSEEEKEKQRQIIHKRFRDEAVRYVNPDTCLITVHQQPFPLAEGCLQYLRQQGIIAHNTYNPVGSSSTCYQLSDQIIIQFSTTAGDEGKKRILEKYHLKVNPGKQLTSKWMLVSITSKSGASEGSNKGKNPIKVAELLQAEPGITSADVNLLGNLRAPGLPARAQMEPTNRMTPAPKKAGPKKNAADDPTDDLFKYQWYLHKNINLGKLGKFKIAPDAGMDVTTAWELLGHRGSADITVAVIDLSLNFKHPDLKDRLAGTIPELTGEYVFYDGSAPIPDSMLIGSGEHGTQCAGLAVATQNGKGVVGVASGCRLLPVWLDANASEVAKIRCFEAVSEKADIISLSLAPAPEKMIGDALTDTLTQIIAHGGRRGRGCVLCVCAGNNQVPIQKKLTTTTYYYDDDGTRQKLQKGEEIYNLFAAHPGAITVTACTSENKSAAYNNYGPEVSVCAPSADWDLKKGMDHLTSAGIYTTTGNGTPGTALYTDRFCGTSASAPLAAGVAALVLSANNTLTAEQVKQVLEQTADKINDQEKAYDNKGHSIVFGYGRINAARAVQLALEMKKTMAQSI